MAWYQARQKENKRWYYTCSNSAGIFDEPCCAEYELCPDCSGFDYIYNEAPRAECERCNSKRLIEKANPCPGHDTAAEAAEHYRTYNVEKGVEGKEEDTQHKCKVCCKWTQRYMHTPGHMFMMEYLCDEHCNKEGYNLATKPKEKEVEKEAPTKLEKSEGYVPKDFDEAVDYLVEQKVPTGDPRFHFSGGMAMRNNWGLWGNSTPIAKWFTERNLFHGDDRSGILSDAVKARLAGESFDVDERIKYYQEWWEKQYGPGYSLENQKKNFFSYADEEENE